MFFVGDDDVEIAIKVMSWNRNVLNKLERFENIDHLLGISMSLSSKWTFISHVMVTGSENIMIHSSNNINSLKNVSDSSIDPGR